MNNKMNTFCFCIYGTKAKYTQGLVENLQSIQTLFPSFHTVIHYAPDVPESYLEQYRSFPNTILEPITTEIPMMSRILSWKPHITYFVRDADSRVTLRDASCIKEFLASNKMAHVVRDHYYHKNRIMGGMFGIRVPADWNLQALWMAWKQTQPILPPYGTDEKFLQEVIYPLIKDNMLLHTNVVAYLDETPTLIPVEQTSDTDFVGNVYDPHPTFGYKQYITPEHIQFLYSQNQHILLTYISKSFPFDTVPWEKQFPLIEIFYIANYYTHNYDQCQLWLSKYKFHPVNEHTIHNSSFLIPALKKTIIASFDPSRVPAEGEFIIQYGEYPHTIDCLPYSNICYRHPLYFNQVKHDRIEYHLCWESIEQIYILNLEERKDRYMHILVELCRMQAPLHRIYHYKAKKGPEGPYIGATQNHLDVTTHFLEHNYKHCLVLEDDFLFHSHTTKCQTQLMNFFKRSYEYQICFLAYSKYGKIEPHDDLVARSFQACTTSSAYLLNSKTAIKIQECFQTGITEMKRGQPSVVYCCDRYWTKLQVEPGFFVFADKLGYQRITHSDITNKVNYNFD
jgi:hypothetical protein